MTTLSVDFLAIATAERDLISYKRRWNQLTGSVMATILLQQIVYRWLGNGRQPFYKFTKPCDHPMCRPDDTWIEELGFTRHEFETARSRIAARTKGDLDPSAYVSYWSTSGHLTWYAVNETLLAQHLAGLYPVEGAAVGVQLTLPTSQPFPQTGNGNSEKRKRQIRKAEMAFPESGNDNDAPIPESGNGDSEKRHPKIIEDHKDYQEQRELKEHATPTAAGEGGPAAVAVGAAVAAADEIAAAAESLAPEATSVAAGATPPAAPVPPSPRDAILDWIEFDDSLSDKERSSLDTSTLLAWAYWVHLKRAERASRIVNPVGLVRAQWRKGQQPRADLLRLARGWLALSDDARGRLLGRLEWASDFGAYDPGDPLDEEFPDIPLTTAATVYAATGGELGPPALMPAEVIVPAGPPTPTPAAQPAVRDDRLWREALSVLKVQLPRPAYTQHFASATATVTPDGLTIHLPSQDTADWIAARMNGSVQEAVDFVAGRPIPIRYEVRS